MSRRIVITEIMVLAIVLGIALIVLARRSADNTKAANNELTKSTEQLRHELERSGDEIVGRIAGHVGRLEALVDKADKSYQRLREEEMNLQTLQQELAQQLTEGHILQQRMKSQLAALGSYSPTANPTTSAEPPHFQLPPQESSAPLSPSPTSEASASPDFATLLAESLSKQQESETKTETKSSIEIEKSGDREKIAQVTTPPSNKTMSMGERAINIGDLADTGAGKARTLLQQGLSVEDVAKETGMGRGAVELLQQMMLRQRK